MKHFPIRPFLPLVLTLVPLHTAQAISPFEGAYGGVGANAQKLFIKAKGDADVSGVRTFQGKSRRQETRMATTLYGGYGKSHQERFYYGAEFMATMGNKTYHYPLKNTTIQMNYKPTFTYQPGVRAGVYVADKTLAYVKAGLDIHQVDVKSNGATKKGVFYNFAPTVGAETFVSQRVLARVEAGYGFNVQKHIKLKTTGANATNMKVLHKSASVMVGVGYKLSNPEPMQNSTADAPAASPMPTPPTAPANPMPNLSGFGG